MTREVDLAARLCETSEWVFSRDPSLVSQACSREKFEKKYNTYLHVHVCMQDELVLLFTIVLTHNLAL